MNNNKINTFSFSFILICLFNSSLLGILFPYIINNSNNSILYNIIIIFFTGLIYLFIYYKIFSFLPDLPLSKKIENIYPKIISKIINIIITILVFFIVIIIFWRFSTFITSEYLTETPGWMISILLALPIYYASYKNVDVAGRCASDIIFTIILLFLFSRISLINKIDIENFKPIIFNGKDSLITSVISSTLLVMPILTTLIVPKNKIVDKHFKKAIFISYIFSFIIFSLILLTIIGILGKDLASIYTFPSYVVLKNLNIFNFIKNIENFSVLFWIMFMSFTCSFNMFFIKSSVKDTFNINKNKTLNIIMTIIFIVFLSIIIYILPYENYINNYKNAYAIIPFIIYIVLFLIIFISYIIGTIKNKITGKSYSK